MNIKEASEYIKDTVKLYLKKDEYGDYRVPVQRQRPVFLIGAPGIGKTAIMEQIASELNIALVSYSMTHHTRQSALGLPYITEKEYGGENYSVSEYTMSEIIASIYDTMNESGINEGILFLDEINCVSETLYPSMLQFLQYKTFGRHRVPEGWVVITAGNPVEFNRMVREFDVVTLDRLKVLNVEADYDAWKAYAAANRVHPAVLGFLDSNRSSFYSVESSADGKNYITARGWEDLSEMLKLYEEEGNYPGAGLIGQYIHNDKIVREFAAYYELYNKYKETYRVNEILEGNSPEETVKKAGEAPVDERLALTGLLLEGVKTEIDDIMLTKETLSRALPSLKKVIENDRGSELLTTLIGATDTTLKNKERAGNLSGDEKNKLKKLKALYEELYRVNNTGGDIKTAYNGYVGTLTEGVTREKERLHNMFSFMGAAFGDKSNEMLVLITELTLNRSTALFLSDFGSEDYDRLNALLEVGSRSDTLRKEIEKLF